jgi:hypothetical protein
MVPSAHLSENKADSGSVIVMKGHEGGSSKLKFGLKMPVEMERDSGAVTEVKLVI